MNAAEVEELFERLGAAGVTLVVMIEPARITEGAGPWTASASGPGAPTSGVRVQGHPTFETCLGAALAGLRDGPGDWEWLDRFEQVLR
ncbi:hypothetical protein E1263_02825 [Kribbella antibiotica]|uniref:Uncharacterized protein n=1 Tax=Kribbella antibiotica TaxID=190195 RepID=A0A4R4ZU48_9ACTN|nr:hypothetical protein [Kribbella antibiotica]TDD62668.1 hypothetical protein E1263_02825 [Kribbella antibiotica]